MRSALRQSAQGYFLTLDQESTLSIIQQIKSHLSKMAVNHPDPGIAGDAGFALFCTSSGAGLIAAYSCAVFF